MTAMPTRVIDLAAVSAATVDPITVEVIGSALTTIVEEMGRALIRASYSTNIKERRDCSAVLFDVEGRTMAQAEHIPMHLGSLLGISELVLKTIDMATVRPGDVFVGNDAHTGGGTHLNDLVFLEPIFHEGALVAWVTNVAHHSDFVDRGHAHIFQEGLRIPPVRLYRAGVLQQDIMDLILLNCQVPRERINDMRAQMAANKLGLTRFQNLCGKYGTETVLRAAGLVMDYSERKTRAGIARIPDGSYSFSETFDTDLWPEDIRLSVRVDVRGDEIFFDFAGNPPQVRAGINAVRTALLATVLFAVKALVDPDIPANHGFYRPIHVDAPDGSIVSAVAPAAVYSRTDVLQRMVDTIFAALAPVVPDRVVAASTGGAVLTISGQHPRTGRYYVYNESVGGGMGARHAKPGLDGVQVHTTNTANLPIEALEMEHPLMVECYELVQDSGGAGLQRGGMGIRRRLRILGHDATVNFGGTCNRIAPWGLAGGLPGGLCRTELSEGAGPLHRREGVLHDGQTIAIVTAGGGGFGDPRQRDPSATKQDVREGRVSGQAARDLYGLAV